jgi:topoisomerase-4 subunit A
METLFRATAFETRFPLNMNVLTADRTPMVLGLRGVLRAWLDHRHIVLQRRTAHRLGAIEKRLLLLDGYLKVFLNIDEVIRIIRSEDEPKPVLMRAFDLVDAQAEAILNMRLRSLRRLEEIEIRKEHAALSKEQRDLQTLLSDPKLRWRRIERELEETRKAFGSGPLGNRRTMIGTPPAPVDFSPAAFVEREAITVILSEKGWIRAVKGHLADGADLKFKEGDRLRQMLPCETTDRLCLFITSGRATTLKAGDLPRGRGDGQPVRLMAEMANEDDIAAMFVLAEAQRYLVASSAGRGFLVKGEDLLAEKRTGKQVLNLRPGETAKICVPAVGDHVAVLGENNKLLIFPLDQVPEMARGAGVILQKYRDGGLSDARVIRLADGLVWRQGERTRTETVLLEWLGERAGAGKLPPRGFPKTGKLG